MSMLQTAFIARSQIPSRDVLEQYVQQMGFDLQIDDYQPFKSSGFLPCTLSGEDSGFEIYFDLTEGIIQDFPDLKEEIGTRDCAITFRWGGNMSECACVLIVSAALARYSDAIILYHDDDILYSAEELVDEAKHALSHVKSTT